MSFFRSDDVTIPLFNVVDYEKWKYRMLLFLQLKKCKEVAVRRQAETDKAEEWNLMEVKAQNYIVSAVTNEQLELVFNETTTLGMLTKFDSLYLKQSTALQIISRRKLEAIRLEDGADPAKFFNDFEKAVNDLKAAGGSVTEDEKANYMIPALPESLAHLGDLVDVIDKEKENVLEYLKYKISVKAKTNGGSSTTTDSGVNSQVFAAASGGKGVYGSLTCYRCGKEGHRRFECTSNFENGAGRGNAS